MFGWFGRKPQYDDESLRAHFLLNECDGFAGALPTEQDFIAWRDSLGDDDISFYQDMGTCSLDRLAADDEQGDVWQWLGDDAKGAWHAYQKANQGYGVIQWCARCVAWVHGLPWF